MRSLSLFTRSFIQINEKGIFRLIRSSTRRIFSMSCLNWTGKWFYKRKVIMRIRKFSSLLIILSFIISLAGALQANQVAKEGAKVGEWTMDYDAALKLAGEKQLPILLNFTGSDWCGWCKLMDRSVFSQAPWQEFARREMVLVTLDFPRNQNIVPAKYVGRNENLRAAYGVEGFPTYMIVDSDGKTVLGKLGAAKEITPAIFIDQLKNLLRFREQEISKRVKSLSPEKGKAYRQAIKAYKDTEAELMKWLETRPVRNDANLKIYEDYLTRLEAAEKRLDEF